MDSFITFFYYVPQINTFHAYAYTTRLTLYHFLQKWQKKLMLNAGEKANMKMFDRLNFSLEEGVYNSDTLQQILI